jgi:hypothetical protein
LAKCNGRRRYWLRLATNAEWKLAGGEQYATNQCSHEKNPELPFHDVLATLGATIPFASLAMPDSKVSSKAALMEYIVA